MYKLERIICSANFYNDGIVHVHQPINITTGYVIAGMRHHNCIAIFSIMQEGVPREETLKLMRTEDQGFITTLNRYVDRKEGLQIALAANQVLDINEIRGTNLYSEDLY